MSHYKQEKALHQFNMQLYSPFVEFCSIELMSRNWMFIFISTSRSRSQEKRKKKGVLHSKYNTLGKLKSFRCKRITPSIAITINSYAVGFGQLVIFPK